MIEVKNLTKRYGKFTALQNISLSVDKGGIYGLVGYNGAGKTTLLKNISGVYKPEEGTVFFDSKPVFDNPKVKEKIFFIPDDLYFGTYANMNKMANFYNGYYSKFDYSMFKRLTAAFGLDPTKRINGFSKGMQRQAEIVLAMSTHPDLILLDESFDGIDPQKRVLIKGLLMEYINDFNAAVIISSHNLTELEDLCTDIGIINGKKIAITGKVTDLSFGKSKYRLAFNRPFTLDEFSGINCQNLKKDGQLAMFTVTGDSEEVQEQIKALNPAVIERINLSLEEIFLEEMEGGSYDFKNILV
ncbi:MAG: ABC transporter ATP-binding protein [Clostridiales bacterium]|nr:ABC transporter ATP-binding protein [Clostridiales bacterium]